MKVKTYSVFLTFRGAFACKIHLILMIIVKKSVTVIKSESLTTFNAS